MPLHIRSSPGGLEEHQGFITSQANYLLSSELFTDLCILTPEGPVNCHSSMIIPLSTFLSSAISSYPSFPGLVHTLFVPINSDIVEKILQIIYTGEVSVTKSDMHRVYYGMRVLGIQLPELVCHREAGYASFLKEEADAELEEDEISILEQLSPRPVPPLPSPHCHQMFPTQLSGNTPLTSIIPRTAISVEGVKPPPALPAQPPVASVSVPTNQARDQNNLDEDDMDSGDISSTEAKRRKRGSDGVSADGVSADGVSAVGLSADAQLVCSLCQAPLTSEWHRNPLRHNCPHSTPSADPPCTPVSSPLHPSRHGSTVTRATQEPHPARKRSSVRLQVKVTKMQQQCPLTNCTWQFTCQKDLLMHLVMTHFIQELEKEFETAEGQGESRCERCDEVLPCNKQGLMEHMAVEHEDIVMAYVNRDKA